MASLRKAKKLGIYKLPKYTKERAKLMSETRKMVEKVNRRLKGLKNAGYKGTWASKKLINRIDTKVLKAWSKEGKIKLSRNLTNTQLKAIEKATEQFLQSKTSTIKGIRDVESATIKSIQETLSDEKRGLVTKEDAEFYYDMFGNNDFNYFADLIGASTLWMLIDEAIENNDNEGDWIRRLGGYITLEDLDIKEKAIRLYNKYIL